MRRIGLAALIISALFSHPALAACVNPTGNEGEMIYNTDYHTMQFCSNTGWISMAGGFTTDARIGTLTASKWCAVNAGGTAIDCTQNAPASNASTSNVGYVQLGAASGAFTDSGTTAGQQLFWDSTNHRLGIGTITPATALHVVGNITSPGSGTTSEKFGSGASVSTFNASLAVGNGATVTADNGTAIGAGANSSRLSVAVGAGATTGTGDMRAVAIGGQATASGSNSIAIGYNLTASAANSIAINGTASGASNIAMNGTAAGSQSSIALGGIGSARSILIGSSTADNGFSGIAIGPAASLTAAGQLVFNSSFGEGPISSVWFGNPVGSLGGNISLNVNGVAGTDIAGKNFTFNGGQSTGTGAGGSLIFQTSAAAGSTGATTNALTERMRINSTGNVGIGTTAPGASLSLGNAVQNNKLYVYESGNIRYGFGISSGEMRSYISSLAGQGHTWGTMDATDGVTYVERMRLTAGGNLGIGTTTPGQKLEVNGNINLTANTGSYRVIGVPSNSDTSLVLESYSASAAGGNIELVRTGSNMYDAKDHTFRKADGTSALMIIDTTNGGVGIGTMSPLTALHVTGVSEAAAITDAGAKTATLRLGSSDVTLGAGGSLEFGAGSNRYFGAIKAHVTNANTNSIGDLVFYSRNAVVDTALTERMRITSAGNVGIGTASPAAMGNGGSPMILQIHTPSSSVALLNLSNTDTASGAVPGVVQFASSALSNADKRLALIAAVKGDALTTNPLGSLVFYTANGGVPTEKLRIDNAGNVGIGTTAPGSKLDVNGTVSATTFNIGVEIKTAAGNSGSSASSANASCSAGKKIIGGGCSETTGGCEVYRSYPNTGSTWQCNSIQWNGSSLCQVTASAICANVN